MRESIKAKLNALKQIVKSEHCKRGDIAEAIRLLEQELEHGVDSPVVTAVRTHVGDSLPMSNVIRRAYQADPKATEMDLIDAGRSDLASRFGADHLAEQHRAKQLRLAV